MIKQNPHLRILEIMDAKGISKSQLADALGIRLPSLYPVLSGNPTIETLYRVADALGCTVHDLLQ